MSDQVGEEALREILCVMHGVPAGAHETVKRRPIGLAKLRERGLRNLRVGLAFSGRENHAPMGRRKGVALTVDGLSQSFHVTGVSESRKKTSREKNHNSVQHRFRNPFVKGKQTSVKHQQRILIMRHNKGFSAAIALCVIAFFTMGSVPFASAATPTPVTITAVYDFST